LIYPSIGTAWYPTHKVSALCDAFIVFFVAELESYWESIVNAALDSYQKRFQSSALKDCASAEAYVSKIVEMRKKFEKNNNANWTRIDNYFIFVGLKEGHFPDGLWDSIESVVSHRGEIVHNSLGLRRSIDPRLTISQIETALARLAIFDRDFVNWMGRANIELERLKSLNAEFVSGLGLIATGDA
jgi:hypothetical protein